MPEVPSLFELFEMIRGVLDDLARFYFLYTLLASLKRRIAAPKNNRDTDIPAP